MLNILPTLIAPKAYQGRIAIKKAFTSYYANRHDLTASALIHARLANCQKWGFSADDIANFEIATLFLATTNTVPTSFWQLSYILSDPSLLEKIRVEVESIITRNVMEDGKEEAVMDITRFQTHCPLLIATFHETLRLVDAATSVRAVTSPTILTAPSAPSYTLKSPAVIQLPSGITHRSLTIWGADVEEFNPMRFMPEAKAKLDKATIQAQKQGFFPFGGGKHLCPGRHMAMMEVLAFVAGVCVGFEVVGDGEGKGELRVPEMAFQKLGTAVRKPVGDTRVKIRRRKGWEGIRWRFDVEGGGEVDFKRLAGDNLVGEEGP